MDKQGQYKILTIASISLLVLATIVLVGLAVVNQFGFYLRDSTTTGVTGITPLIGSNVSLGVSYPYPQSLTGCFNASNSSQTLSSGAYNVYAGSVASTGGYIELLAAGSDFNNTAINCTSLTYLASSDASNNATLFGNGLAIFGTFSAVIALALIGRVIVSIFRKKKGDVE